jgi:hypothetical protein
MNFLSRLIMLLILSISLTAPAGAAVTMDVDGYCDVVAADDDKKTDGDKKPEGEGDEEPECD